MLLFAEKKIQFFASISLLLLLFTFYFDISTRFTLSSYCFLLLRTQIFGLLSCCLACKFIKILLNAFVNRMHEHRSIAEEKSSKRIIDIFKTGF